MAGHKILVMQSCLVSLTYFTKAQIRSLTKDSPEQGLTGQLETIFLSYLERKQVVDLCSLTQPIYLFTPLHIHVYTAVRLEYDTTYCHKMSKVLRNIKCMC